jgi:hypothetical protein
MSFDRSELTKAAYHLAFDIYHFRFYARLYKEGRLTAFGPAVQQAFLYSLLLHFRILLDFFYKEPVQDDCGVGHFRIFPEFDAAFPPGTRAPVGVRQVSVNLNKRLAHITATRWREKPPSMTYYTDYFDGIEKLIVDFQAALPGDLRQTLSGRLAEFEAQYQGSFQSGEFDVYSSVVSSGSGT